jgi:hypothetical protein
MLLLQRGQITLRVIILLMPLALKNGVMSPLMRHQNVMQRQFVGCAQQY